MNIYAPNSDDPKFFIEAVKHLDQYSGKRILVGDFNLTLNPEVDRSNRNAQNHDKASEIISQYMEDTFLTDVWRDRNPHERKYTFCRMNPVFTGSRIDNVLIETAISSWVHHIEIIPGYRSDHSAIIVKMRTIVSSKGKGLWKMNNQLLYEKEYLELIRQNITEVRDLAIQTHLNHREKWEMTKLRGIAVTQSYAYECSLMSIGNWHLSIITYLHCPPPFEV